MIMLLRLIDFVLLSTTFLSVYAKSTTCTSGEPRKNPGAISPICLKQQTCTSCYNEYVWCVDYGTGRRTFGVYVPEDYDPTVSWPLIFDFHGAVGTSAKQYCNSQYFLHPLGKEFIVVYPQGLQEDWYGPPYAPGDSDNDIEFVSELLIHTKSTFNISQTQIYASGKSAGAGFVNTLACSDIADNFSAFAMASAALYTDSSATCSQYTNGPPTSNCPSPPGDACTDPVPTPPVNPDCCKNVWNDYNKPPFPFNCQPRNILEVHGWSDPTIYYEWDPPYCDCNRCHAKEYYPGTFLPQISDWAYSWAVRNGASNIKKIPSGGSNFLFNYTAGNATINHYRIDNLKHCWPQNAIQNTTNPNTDYQRDQNDTIHKCVPTWMDFTDVVINFFANPANPSSSQVDQHEFKSEL